MLLPQHEAGARHACGGHIHPTSFSGSFGVFCANARKLRLCAPLVVKPVVVKRGGKTLVPDGAGKDRTFLQDRRQAIAYQ